MNKEKKNRSIQRVEVVGYDTFEKESKKMINNNNDKRFVKAAIKSLYISLYKYKNTALNLFIYLFF